MKIMAAIKTNEELGIHPSVLQRWKREQEADLNPRNQNKPTYEELEKQVWGLKQECLSKKATTFMATYTPPKPYGTKVSGACLLLNQPIVEYFL